MTASASGRIWDDAFSPAVGQVVQRFEADWQASSARSRPDPRRYLPENPELASGALLALLRAEMGLRHSAGEEAAIEGYLKRYPGLDSESLVALIYEDFCLREEDGEEPDPSAYYDRFPELASRLRPVLDIHELVGSGRTVSFPESGAGSGVAYPEVGETIGGFYLAAELGRGSFARVFRAEERQLADRPVALKVARKGSREPQTLARLQHTHIVPVHSYRVDRVSGLHLLCMPYLGSVTLAKLLASPGIQRGRKGTDLLETLDGLETGGTLEPNPLASSRQELARRSFVQAIAWWGSRLAEALQHAHDRGVLHRDIKPSNVLVTSDGLPMLLDFNLAWEACLEDGQMDPSAFGGTLAYMAPEQLEALASGSVGSLDAHCDLYSLGVVLYEAVGGRPFEMPPGRSSVTDTLRRMAAQRRKGPPRLGKVREDISPAFEAVVQRCLAAEPGARYATAAELAADLQAVANDQPLRFAREPWPSRSARWIRRNRAKAALVAPLLLAPAMVLLSAADARFKRENMVGQLLGEMRQLLREGNRLLDSDQIELAQSQFLTAYDLGGRQGDVKADGWLADPRLQFWQDEARDKLHLAREKTKIRTKADQLFENYEQLCLHLMGFVEKGVDLSQAVTAALAPFYVLPDPDWPSRPELILLDAQRRDRLFDTVDDLLFLWVLDLDGRQTASPEQLELATSLCDKGVSLSRSPRPWEALQQRFEARKAGKKPRPLEASDPATAAASSRTCFRWGLLLAREGQKQAAITWLDRASRLEPMQFWYHYYLGLQYQRIGEQESLALTHYNMAVALRPNSPFVRFSRANLFQKMGQSTRALEDLDVALEHVKPAEAVPMRLNRGALNQTLGRFTAARQEYDAVIEATSSESPYHRAARWNLARIEAELGRPKQALAIINELIASGAMESPVRLSRAVITLQLGETAEALRELDSLIEDDPRKPEYYNLRARARFEVGLVEEAQRDALRACELDPSPVRVRLRIRMQLASSHVGELPLEDLEEWQRLPLGGQALRADLKRAAKLLDEVDGTLRIAKLNRAIILSVLNEHAAALAQADRVLQDDPESIKGRWVRSQLRAAAGDQAGAIEDLERGLEMDPGNPLLLEREGLILVDSGEPEMGLRRLDLALQCGAGATAQRGRAEAYMALGRPDQAIEAWTTALEADPQDPRAYLGRARAAVSSGLGGDYALADLENAAAWAGDYPELLLEVTREYARFVTQNGDRLPRVLSLVGRSFGLYLRALTDNLIDEKEPTRIGGRSSLMPVPPG